MPTKKENKDKSPTPGGATKKTTAKKTTPKASQLGGQAAPSTKGGSTSGRKKTTAKKAPAKKVAPKKAASKKTAPKASQSGGQAVAKKAPAKNKVSKKDFVYAVGRRKNASARVRLFTGKGQSEVNSKPIAEYFPGEMAEMIYTRPLKVCEVEKDYYFTVRVLGSGKQSQLEATAHGLARALDKTNRETFHEPLKRNGLLTRDSRRRERRKPGLGGRARHKKQSPKR